MTLTPPARFRLRPLAAAVLPQMLKLEPPYKPGDEVTDTMIGLVASDCLSLIDDEE